MSEIRPELSKNSKYYVPKHRYYELMHACLQYPEWKRSSAKLEKELLFPSRSYATLTGVKAKNYEDVLASKTAELADLTIKIDTINKCISSLDSAIQDYIFRAVTIGKTFNYFKTKENIPYGKNLYYKWYRYFFWILDKEWK